jgi:UDP-N-acetylmuramoyl-tripeptide--D-alanyl-D-alanine ligase
VVIAGLRESDQIVDAAPPKECAGADENRNDSLVISGDEPALRRIAAQHRGRVLTFGRAADCELTAADISFENGRLQFRLGQQWFRVPAWARSSLKEVLAAVAVGRIFGVPLDTAAERLARVRPSSQRRQVMRAGDVTIIHDTAADEPDALRRALDLLREYPAAGRRVVCCGQLADGNEATYRTFGEDLVSRCGADELIACGTGAQVVVEAAHAAGLSATSAMACVESREAARRIVATLTDGDLLLVVGEPPEVMPQLVKRIRDSLCVGSAPQGVVRSDISTSSIPISA